MSDRLRVLLSGPGLIGSKHCELIKANTETELAAIVAPNTDKNVEFAASRGVPVFRSIEKAIGAVDVDCAIISSPNEVHFEQAMFCIQCGLPFLVEKPLTNTLVTARNLMEEAEKRGVLALVGHHRTYSPLLGLARDFLASEMFGKPVSVQGSALFYKPDDYFADGPWRTRKGGGPILINLIHEIGILRYLYGEIESVMAQVSCATRRFEVEDTAAISLSFRNGALGTFILSDVSASSKSWEMTAGENAAYPFFPNQDCYHFSGSMGSLDFPSMNARSYGGSSNRSWWKPFQEERLRVERADPLERQLSHFVDVVRGVAEPRVSLHDGYMNLRVLNAITRSSEMGVKMVVEG